MTTTQVNLPADLRETPFTDRYPEGVEEWIDVYGYAVPLWLSDPMTEYTAIRSGAAMLEYSMLYKWFVEGPGAVAAVDAVFSRDVTAQPVGQLAYGVVTDVDGLMIDDVTVAIRSAESVLVVGGNPITEGLLRDAADASRATVVERRDDFAVLSLQGPRSREVLQSLVPADISNAAFPYYTFRTDLTVAGIRAEVNRVGFTAELGYEIVVPRHRATELWDAVLEAGQDKGAQGIGAAALMIARIEAGMIMGELEYDHTVSPYECRLGWAVDLEKSPWLGQDALRALKSSAPGRVVTVRVEATPETAEGSALHHDGTEIGRITMAVPSPQIDGATLAMARIAKVAAPVGTMLVMRTGEGDEVEVEVLRTPVYEPERTRVRS